MQRHGQPGGGYSRRTVLDIITGIAALPTDAERVDALRASPLQVKQILYMVFGPVEMDLPRGEIRFTPISTRAWSELSEAPDDDLLASEAPRLLRIFAQGVHPALTSRRRLELFLDILERVPRGEADLLLAMKDKRLPEGLSAITREAVDEAWPGLLETVPVPERDVATGYEQFSKSRIEGPVSPPAPVRTARREPNEADRLWARIRWG